MCVYLIYIYHYIPRRFDEYLILGQAHRHDRHGHYIYLFQAPSAALHFLASVSRFASNGCHRQLDKTCCWSSWFFWCHSNLHKIKHIGWQWILHSFSWAMMQKFNSTPLVTNRQSAGTLLGIVSTGFPRVFEDLSIHVCTWDPSAKRSQ